VKEIFPPYTISLLVLVGLLASAVVISYTTEEELAVVVELDYDVVVDGGVVCVYGGIFFKVYL
jgi:hypothetical protein